MSLFGVAPEGLELYHVGLVVPDLGEAMRAYSKLFGFAWATVGGPRTQHVVAGGVRREAEILVTYSLQGPPHLELIEERNGDIWSSATSPLNHIGFWAPDLTEAMSRFAAAGLPAAVHDTGPETEGETGTPRFSYHPMAGGLWVELVGPGFRPQLEAWIAASSSAL